jgi:site-specific DNA-methyltransferase (adenine-specific)
MSNDVTLYTGECAAVMAAHIPDGSIDLTVTSPPYDGLREYRGYTFDFEAIAAQLWRVTKPGGVVVWVVADATVNGSETGTSFRQALGFMGLGFNLHDTMIYRRSAPQFPETVRYASVFEYMFIMSKESPTTANLIKVKSTGHGGFVVGSKIRGTQEVLNVRIGGGMRVKDNVWDILSHGTNGYSDPDAANHPAIFPEALARDHILSWSNPGDVVLDPMCGSGTTLKMAVTLGRRAIGIDIAAEYIALTRERVGRAQLQAPLFPHESERAVQMPLDATED